VTAALLIALWATVPAASAVQQGPEIYAVIVGYNGGNGHLPELRYADDDALRFARAFSSVTDATRIFLLADLDADTQAHLEPSATPVSATSPPTRNALFRTLAKVGALADAAGRSRPIQVYVYFAGHGLKGRLLLKPEFGEEAAITGQELRTALSNLNVASIALLIDACRSQSLFVDRGNDSVLGPDFGAEIERLERRAGALEMGVLTAAAVDERAAESEPLRGGFFSHVLASGLFGAADANGDFRITYGELFAFVTLHTRGFTSTRPWFDPPRGDPGALVMELESSPQGIVFSPEAYGRIQVQQGRQDTLIAELNKARGRPLRLALAPGAFRVNGKAIRVDSRMWETVNALSPVPRGVAVRGTEGPENAFSTPFTPDVVEVLQTGFLAGRERSTVGDSPDHTFEMGYSFSPGPLRLRGSENGFHVSYRFAWSRFQVGPWVDFRTSLQPHAGGEFGLRRVGTFLHANVQLVHWRQLRLLPAAWVGLRSIWVNPAGAVANLSDLTAPSAGLGALLEIELARHYALIGNARAEGTWLRGGTSRRFFGSFVGGVAFAYRP